MLTKAFSVGSALLVCAMMVSLGLAQQQPPPPPPGQGPPGGAPPAYRAKQVIGSQVNIQGNVSIGTVEDIVFNDVGQVEFLIVQNQNKLVTVPWQAAKFNFEKHTAVVNITPEQFQKVPTYTVGQYPAFFTPGYVTQTYQYYGLTPRQERRVERKLSR